MNRQEVYKLRESNQTAYPKAMANIRKITAMGVAAMEQIKTPPR